MTPEEARALSAKAREIDPVKVRIVLDMWERAIKKAAEDGRYAVRQSDLDVVRTPIPAKAYDIALLELKRRGYRVSTVEERPNETTTEVSWSLT